MMQAKKQKTDGELSTCIRISRRETDTREVVKYLPSMGCTVRTIADVFIQKFNLKTDNMKRFVENYQNSAKRFVVFHKGITKLNVEYYNISALHNLHIQGGQSYD